MSIVIPGSIFNELNASLTKSTNSLSETINRLATGFKINSAEDGAAEYAIITKLETEISSLDVATDNIEQGISMISTAEGYLEDIKSHLERINSLVLMASNSTLNQDDLKAIQLEIDSYSEQILSIQQTAEYDGINLFQENYTLDKDKSYVTQDNILKELDTPAITTFSLLSEDEGETATQEVVTTGKIRMMTANAGTSMSSAEEIGGNEGVMLLSDVPIGGG